MWEDITIPMLRVLIGDIDSPQTYTDSRLHSVLLTSAYIVERELDFDYTYAVDIVGSGVTPDPSDDEAFINLTVLKAACIITMSEFTTGLRQTDSTGDAISVTKGPSSISKSRTNQLRLRQQFAEGGFCKAYADAKFEYQAGQASVGHAILGPFINDNVPYITTYDSCYNYCGRRGFI